MLRSPNYEGPRCHQPKQTKWLIHRHNANQYYDETYFLYSLRGQNNRVLVSDADTIFDTDSNAPEVSRPSLVIGNVDTTKIRLAIIQGDSCPLGERTAQL